MLSGCDSNDDTPPPPPDDGKIRSIALTPGTTFTYSWSITTTSRDFEGNVLDEERMEEEIVLAVASSSRPVENIDNTIEVNFFRSTSPDTLSSKWYVQSEDALTDRAFENPGILPNAAPKHHGNAPLLPMDLFPDLPGENHLVSSSQDITLREEPRIVVPFPLEPGTEWVSFRVPFLQTREALAEETLETPAGSFTVIRIQTMSTPLTNDTVWLDFVGAEGLIRRTFTSEVPLRDNTGTPIGVLTTIQELLLIDLDA